MHTYTHDFGPSPRPVRRAQRSPRRVLPTADILDKLLVDAAQSGAEIREGFTVEEILIEDGRAVGIKGTFEARRIRPNVRALSSAPTAALGRGRRGTAGAL